MNYNHWWKIGDVDDWSITVAAAWVGARPK